MDIPGLSMSMSQIDLRTKVGAAMLGKILDTAETSGEAMVGMLNQSMELSVNPNIGSQFDMSV